MADHKIADYPYFFSGKDDLLQSAEATRDWIAAHKGQEFEITLGPPPFDDFQPRIIQLEPQPIQLTLDDLIEWLQRLRADIGGDVVVNLTYSVVKGD